MPEYDLAYWKRWQASVGPSSSSSSIVASKTEAARDKSPHKSRAASNKPTHLGANTKGCSFSQAPRLPPHVAPANAAAPHFCQKRETSLRVRGGAMSQARRKTIAQEAASLQTEGPGPGEYGSPSHSQKMVQGGTFSGAPRWQESENILHSGASAYGSGHEDALLRHQSARCTLRLGEARIPEDPAVRESADVPGPGEYAVPAMRDERTAIVGPPDNTSSKAKIELACQREGARYRLRVPLNSYGYGHACRRKAHVHYGQCNDARCSKRGAWERRGDRPAPDADHLPIAQYALLDLDGIRKSDKALIRTLQSLKLSERDHLGRTALQALAAAEFEAEDRQVHKADLLYMAAEQTAQKLDLDAQDKDGNSALHLAVQTEQAALVEWLVRKGADPELENNTGQTALHMACALHGHHRIYQLLQAAISMLDMQAELSQLEAKRQAKVVVRVR